MTWFKNALSSGAEMSYVVFIVQTTKAWFCKEKQWLFSEDDN